MKILAPVFSTPHPESGGITRMSAIADVLIQNGHEILFLASGYQAKTLSSKGYSVEKLPEPTFFGLGKSISSKIQKRMHTMQLPVPMSSMWFLYSFAGNIQAPFLDASLIKALETIITYKPQALLTDYSPVAYLLRKITDLPLASTYSEIYMARHKSILSSINQRTINKILKKYYIQPENIGNLFFGNSVFKIIPNIPELDGIDPDSPNTYYSGSLFNFSNKNQDDFPVDTSKRYIFVYVGTGSITLQKLDSVLPRVFSGIDNTLCVVGSPAINKAYQKGGVHFYPHVSAQKILPYCDWTICHGGQNTITESLLAGVPLIIFPGNIWERQYNGQKIEIAGAGRMGKRKNFNPQWLSRVCRNPAPYKAHSKRLGIALKNTQGAEGTYEQLMKFYNKQQMMAVN